MKKIFPIFLSLFLFFACTTNKKIVLEQPPVNFQFQQVIDSIYNKHSNVKGIMVHVESSDKNLSWSGASGYSDFTKKTPLQKDQPALIASSIKTYVSASILKLQEQGLTSIEEPIEDLVSPKTKELLINDGYDLDAIKIKHLLSHTSGIEDYINPDHAEKYLDMVDKDKRHRWTREEQIALTVSAGDPLGPPAIKFNYADANYLLLTEIIETLTKKPFYEAMRDLLKYKELGLNNTWFYTLEDVPTGSQPLAHQYYGKLEWDSYDIDPSFDLYGGGGIACTTQDLAKFSHSFFNQKIVKDKAILDLIFSEIKTVDGVANGYYLGLSKDNINGEIGYGHGGFWGTTVLYFPELDTSIAVYVLERDENKLRRDVLQGIMKEIQK